MYNAGLGATLLCSFSRLPDRAKTARVSGLEYKKRIGHKITYLSRKRGVQGGWYLDLFV